MGLTPCYYMPQELFGSEGVEMTVHFLKMSTEKFYSGLGHNKLILSTVDCVWSVHLPIHQFTSSICDSCTVCSHLWAVVLL